MRLNNHAVWAFFSLNLVSFTCWLMPVFERENTWLWVVKEESDRVVRRINGKITALKQEAEKQPWSGAHCDGASELFRAIQESCAQIAERWSTEALTSRALRQNQYGNFTRAVRLAEPGYVHPIIPCVRVVTWAAWKALELLTRGFMEDPAGYYFYYAAFYSAPDASARSPQLVLLRRTVFALFKSCFAK